MPKFVIMMVMSKKLWGLILGLSVLFILFSCSNSQAIILNNQEATLRNQVVDKEKSTVWTKEIEADRLNVNINSFVNIYDRSLISPRMIQTLRNTSNPVYPQISNLGSLDTSQMNKNLFSIVQDFCNQLKKTSEDLEAFFDPQYFFNYVFFKKDLKDIWPVKDEEELFDHYIICKAFESEDLNQVPVRLYKNQEYIDLSLFLIYHNGYRVSQIEIIGWGKVNGEKDKEY